MKSNKEGRRLLRTADRVFDRLAVYLSYISAICLVVMGILAVVDVILSKVAGSGIAVQKEIIEQFMVPVFILFVANIQFTGGLMSVDILSKHYGPTMRKVLDTVTCVLGAVIMSFAGRRVFVLFQDYLRKQTRASQMMSSIKIWPYALCLSIGLFTLAFAYVWTLVRIYLIPDRLPGNGEAVSAEPDGEGGDR